jgi:hypothetical protein
MIANIETLPPKASASLYHLKVTVQWCKPSIWRRLQVPGDANLGWLHAVLQVAVGWTNSHLHDFAIGKDRYSDPSVDADMDFGDSPCLDETKAILADVLPNKGEKFGYEYDFGDSWSHVIKVEKILPPDPAWAGKALCLAGANACPPEDCGGPPGYDGLIAIMADPKHEEHESMKEWLGRPLDPTAFDIEKTNTYLRKLKWPRTTENHLRKVLMARDGYEE